MAKYIVGIIVIIVVAAGGYYLYTSYGGSMAQDEVAAGDTVQVQEVVVGEGEEATPGSTVSITYEGFLADGTLFDSSAAHNNEPLTFVLGGPDIIPGFQIG